MYYVPLFSKGQIKSSLSGLCSELLRWKVSRSSEYLSVGERGCLAEFINLQLVQRADPTNQHRPSPCFIFAPHAKRKTLRYEVIVIVLSCTREELLKGFRFPPSSSISRRPLSNPPPQKKDRPTIHFPIRNHIPAWQAPQPHHATPHPLPRPRTAPRAPQPKPCP